MQCHLCPIYPQSGRSEKAALNRSLSSCPPKKYQEVSTKERKNEPQPGTLVQFVSLRRPSASSTLPSDLQRGYQGAARFFVSPNNSFPGLKNQLGHHGPAGFLSKSLNRSCSSPELRVEEGVHAKILCF